MAIFGKRALVTGGAGFIGSSLCARLIELGCYVLCVDNFSTGSLESIDALAKSGRFEFLKHDIREPLDVPADAIFNLACPGSPLWYQRDPVGTLQTNVFGAFNMLKLAERLSIPILQASTSEVYGDPAIHPQTEEYPGSVNPVGIRACYDEGKRCAEAMFFDFHRQYRVDIKVARIFNVYGPGMRPDDGRVVPNFIVQTLRNQPLTIYGNGAQTRSFCYIDDLIDGLIALMNSDRNITGPVNLGCPGELSVLELAEKIGKLAGAQLRISHRPLPKDDPGRREPDINLARSILGWEPKTRLDDGLAATITAFRTKLSQ